MSFENRVFKVYISIAAALGRTASQRTRDFRYRHWQSMPFLLPTVQ
jgi:hypothetical protein